MEMEIFADTTAFASVVTVIMNLAAEDERIVEYLRVISTGDRTDTGELIEIEITELLAEKVDATVLLDNLKLKVWDKVAKLNWRPFEEARDFARSLGTNQEGWYDIISNGGLPADIPRAPFSVYKEKGWINWRDWTGRNKLSYDDAREFSRSLNLKTSIDWREYCKANKLPPGMPSRPDRLYKDNGWNGWTDWLAYEKQERWRPFEEARDFARSLGFMKESEWKSYCFSGKRPPDIPAHPWRAYKDKGWISIPDWLGTFEGEKPDWRPFEEARKYARSLGIEKQTDWFKFGKMKQLPADIPVTAERVYKSEWISWPDWLGTFEGEKPDWRPFEDARAFAHQLDINTQVEWYTYWETAQRPKDIPYNPQKNYKDIGWKSWKDWLGTEPLIFNSAREFVRHLGLKSTYDWKKYCASGNRPRNIPACPWNFYKGRGWIGMKDWLGN